MRQPTSALSTALIGFEGRRDVVYLDIAGVPTAGVGHTGGLPAVGTKVTDAQIDAWLAEDIQDAIACAYRYIPAEIIEALPAASYDALLSFLFNVGDQAFRNPKTGKPTNFSKALTSRKYDEVDDRMRDWVYSGGKKVSGLVSRRAAESAWWNRGFEANPMQVPVPIVPMDVHAELPEESGVVPDLPPKAPILPPRITAAVTTLAAGAASTAAPDALVTAGTHLRSLLPDFKVFTLIGAILIAAGTGLMLWHQIHQSNKSGA